MPAGMKGRAGVVRSKSSASVGALQGSPLHPSHPSHHPGQSALLDTHCFASTNSNSSQSSTVGSSCSIL